MQTYLKNRYKTLIAFPKQNGAVLISVVTAMISVLMILAVGNGMANGIANQLKPTTTGKLEIVYAGEQSLHSSDAAFLENMKGIQKVTVGSTSKMGDGEAIFNHREMQVSLASTTSFPKIKMIGQHQKVDAKSVWLNKQAAWLLPLERDQLRGQTITIEGKQYQINGLYQTNLLDGGNLPDVLMSKAAFQNLGITVPNNKLIIKFKLPQGISLKGFETKILSALALRSPAAQKGQFAILDNSMLSDSMHKLVKNISTFVVAISSMSLVVSGLSILNNSYANIAMRSPEIALRRVLGASKKDIRNQFLGESFMLLLCGVIIGAVITELVIFILGLFKVKTALSFIQIILVGAIPLLIGMLASVGPANFAGSKNITDLLRTDYS